MVLTQILRVSVLLVAVATLSGCTDEASTRKRPATTTASGPAFVADPNVEPGRVDAFVSRTSLPGLRLETSVDRERANKCPVWRTDAANPPVSAREAIDSAQAAVNSLDFLGNETEWEMNSAELQSLSIPSTDVGQHWIWAISFSDANSSEGWSPHVVICVLMDSSVVTPTIERVDPKYDGPEWDAQH